MYPNFYNFINPLQEHLVKQEETRRHNSLLGLCFAFCLGLIVCYLVIKNQTSTGASEEET